MDKKQNNKIKLPKQNMRAAFSPETFDEENSTVDIIWTTGAQVKRYDWMNGEYIEELSMKKSDIRMERLNLGAPFLKNHSSRDLEDTIGVVEKASIKGGQGHATIKLSSNEDARGIVQNIKDGILRNISVGYKIHKMEDVSKKKDEIPTYRATDWEPMEISLVNIPADPAAQVRSEIEDETFDAIIIRNEENEMAKKKKASKKVEKKEVEIEVREENQDELNNSLDQNEEIQDNVTEEVREEEVVETQPAVEVEQPASDEDLTETRGANEENDMEVRKLEKERCIEIRKAVKSAGLDEALAETMIENDIEIEAARKEIIETLSKRNEKVITKNHNVEVNDMDNKTKRSEATVRAILHRNDSSNKLEAGDNQFMGHSLVDTARRYLDSEGVSTVGMTPTDIAKRALHSTSDFAKILGNVANKELRAAYDEAPQTFMPFTRERSVSDFKQISSLQLGEGGALEKVNENGEYKRGTMSESEETYKVEKYGKILGLTYELIVNDDLDAFTRIPAILGRKARDKESELVWNILIANAAMADGTALFHADHGNLAGSGAAIAIATLGAARAAMRLQTGIDGEILNLSGKYLVVPAGLETVADQFVSSITPEQGGNVNPFANRLQVISEPRLDADSATKWYMMSDKAQLAMMELARLDGKGPEIVTREGFDIDGIETKIRYTFGVKALDHRGFYQNPGA